MKNMAALLLLSQGIPMILSGDEVGRSQRGNNNPYCQDNATSWFDWDLVAQNGDLLRFFQLLIRFRKHHAQLRPCHYPDDLPLACASAPAWPAIMWPTIAWHGCELNAPDWSHESRTLAMHIFPVCGTNHHIYLIANAHWEAHRFHLPDLPRPALWCRVADTYQPAPHDIYPEEEAPSLRTPNAYEVGPRSVVILVSR